MSARFIGTCKDCGGETRAALKLPERCRRCFTAAWEERFWAKVDKSGECWLWTARCLPNGYARFGSTGYAHRVSYELAHGPIPEGLHIDHLCRVRNCVNPAHLEAVLPRENNLRGVSPAAKNATKTHCLRGHALSGDNLGLTPNGGRLCMVCRRAREAGRLNGWERQRRAKAAA